MTTKIFINFGSW